MPCALNVHELQGPVLTSCWPPNSAGHEHEQRVVAAGGRDRVDDSLGQHRLTLRALHVDDRRLAGDRDGLRDRADAHVGVDGGDDEPVSSMPSRLTVLKPVSVNVTV